MLRKFAMAAAAATVLLCSLGSVRAVADEAKGAPYFSVAGESKIERLPLLQTHASVNIIGPIAEVTLKQVFENRGSATIEANYVFPASDRGAVSALTMRIGDRVVEAKIQERNAAHQTYEAAKEAGHTTTLLEQHDTGTFVMNLANILPGDRIDVELRYTELLVPTDGVYELLLPNTFGVERYTRRRDASVQTPRSDAAEVTDYSFGVDARIMAGVPIATIESPSHHIVVDKPSSAEGLVRLADDEVKASTRDFVLRYSLAGGEIANGLSLFPGTSENFFLLMTQPPRSPAPASVPPREYVFILDVSGSMEGAPMQAAKEMMRVLLATLRAHDRFNLVLFAGGSDVLAPNGSLPVGGDTIAQAMSLIDGAHASGGTELISALEASYAIPRATGMSRSIVVLTEGGIAAGGDASRLIREHLDQSNLFAFGVGPSADMPVMHRIARAGLGEPFFAVDAAKGMAEIERFRQFIEQPLLTNVEAKFIGFDAYDVIPQKIPDLFARRPIVLIGKYRGTPGGEIHLSGISGTGRYDSTINVSATAASERNSPLRTLWARERIADRLDEAPFSGPDEHKNELIKLSLDYEVLTPYTAFVAVSEEKRTDGAAPVKVDQPTPLSAGMSYGGRGDALLEGARLFAGLAASNIARPVEGDLREIAGKQFRHVGDTWIDAAHEEHCITLRIRRGSAAYAKLLELRPDLATWIALGDRVLVRLGRYSVLIAADGFGDYPSETLARAARG
jgi:Ca-activated chloride channel family protein